MNRHDASDKAKTVEPPGTGAVGASGLLGIDGLVAPPRGVRSRVAHVAIVATEAGGALGLSLERAFESLGRQVSFIPYADWLPSIDGLRGANILNRSLAGVGRPVAEMRLVAAVARAKPDLVLLVKCDDLHMAAYAAIRRAVTCPIAAFHPDDPWNIGTTLRPGAAHRRALLQVRAVDAMLLWSRPLVERAMREGAQRVFHFPFACDPDLHPRLTDISAEERAELGAPITFIGAWDDEREQVLGAVLDAGMPLAIWGPDAWTHRVKHPKVKAAYRGRPLFGREHAAAVGASDLVLHVLKRQNKDATSMRTFEIPSMGGCMVHERSAEAGFVFPPGVAALDFGSKEELVEVCRRALADPTARRAIADEGFHRARRHTYKEWVTRLMDKVAHLVPDPTGAPPTTP
ncbi:MAG: glycosyltransferase [Deltaproteobacteria bacterium]|nr:glycosyltransferase [Deltaproteobacteria bacterium]